MLSALRDLPEARAAALAAGLLVVALALDLVGAPTPVALLAYAGCYAAGGWGPLRDGLEALRERRIDVDVLTVVAALAAASIGQWQDGALLLVIFTTSGALEELATRRTEQSVRALVDLSPEEAIRVDEDGGTRTVAAADLMPGDRALVRPGARLPADGRVVEGASDVDESAVTGEPLPAPRRPGDDVYAGTLNGAGALQIEVMVPATESVVGRITTLVDEAAAAQSPTQLFVERFEQRYAVGVVVVTCLLLGGLPLVVGLTWRDTLLRSMTFMVVASPCAIVLATMPALLSTVALCGRNGLLVKGGTAVEKLAGVDAVVFDKTGTLTLASPQVATVEPAPGWTEAGLLAMAGAVESASEHVLAAAVVEAAEAAGATVRPADDVTALPGRGVRGRVAGVTVAVGNRRLVAAEADQALEARARALQEGGATAVWVQVGAEVAGLLGIRDQLRDGSPAAVAWLAELGVRRQVLLTGDRAPTARALAGAVGLTEVHADLLPAGKVERVRELRGEGHRVLAVGDGLNDAPMLAAADCAVAMGLRGSDLTLERADVVLRTEQIAALPAALQLARTAGRRVRQNLALALTAIAVLVTLDLAGHLPLALGVAGHEGSTLLVALNGMRLLRQRRWPVRDGSAAQEEPARPVQTAEVMT